MEGLGNDFVVVEGIEPSTDEIIAWCDRRTGVGADGVLAVSRLTNGDAALRMRYWNSDGSTATMCGNGLRCVALFGYQRGYTDGAAFVVRTDVGLNRAEVRADGRVRVELAPYAVGDAVEIGGAEYITATVGNDHAVRFVEDATQAPVRTVGRQVAADPVFPNGTNVEFVSQTDDGLEMRVWERGAGETMACGSGAAASVAVAHHAGLVGEATTVGLAGGPLDVELIDGIAWLIGPATEVFEGRWSGGAR